ncbi:MAG: hypothetical protein U9Q81_13990 [Pseudomonadota bacterium]|nr:hypothetical protein [Pseudomonadota bacterium]
MSETTANGQKRRLAPLWAMIAVFAAPVVAAWFFYFNPQYLPSGRTNLGELIEPVVPLPADLGLRSPEGAELDRDVLRGKWTLVFLGEGDCGDACAARLGDLRQIRLALGESRLNVERLLILPDSLAPGRASDLGREFEGMHIALVDAEGGDYLLDLLGEGSAGLERIYILDPMGNLMMRYAADAPAKDTLKDMERLLKASKNWFKGAQYGHK